MAARKERKVVTVLFCDLVGFTSQAESLDPEDVDAFLRGYHERVKGELERFGGTVEKFAGDAALALFGAPVAHEDDPERAVRAALAIRDWALEDGEVSVRIGITTGEALVTLGGADASATGDVVNTASRLQTAAAENGILVDEATRRATARVIEYADHDPVEAKGKATPILVYEPREARSRFGVDVERRSETPLVGRVGELSLLLDALARARDEREPQLVTIVGVPGIGKTRLVAELFHRVDEDPELIVWRQGRSLPYGDGVAYWALGEMVKAQAGILESDDTEEAAVKLGRAVRELVVDDAEWVAARLRPLVGLAADRELSGDRRDEAFAAWRRFLEAIAEQGPAVLVFEDLHWADEGLLDFVDELVDWAVGVPLLVAATSRPELLTRRRGWGGGKPNAVTISLSPLSDEDTARLVHTLLDQSVLPAELQSQVLERAGGNPLYAEEFARAVAEGGAAERVPESIQGLIAGRLDSLDQEDKAVLQNAAVLGKVFWLGALASMDGDDPAALERRLRLLERREFVRRARQASVAGEHEFAFRHLLVRDVAYGQIPRGERAEKHQRAAEWIHSLGRPEDHAELLAHHYLEALEYARAAGRDAGGLTAPAARALADAGSRALALNSFPSAVRYLEAALDLTALDDSDRPQLLFRFALAVHASADARAEDVLTAAREAALAAGLVEAAAELDALLAEVWWHRGRRDRTFALLRRAEDVVRNRGASPSKARVLAQLSRYLMIAAEYDDAIRVGREAWTLAGQLGLDELQAHALINIGSARCGAGDFGGIADLERGIEVAEAIGSPEASRGYNNLGAIYEMTGDLRRHRALREQAFRVGERFGARLMTNFSRVSAANAAYLEGRWDDFLGFAEAYLAEAERTGSRYQEPHVRSYLGEIALARGDERKAVEEAIAAVDLARELKDLQLLLPALASAVQVLAEAGRPTEARRHTDELLELAGATLWSHEALAKAALVAHAIDGMEKARAVADALAPETRWLAAARAALVGDLVGAADLFAEIGSLPDEAYARLRSGVDSEVRRALDFYRSVGASRYVREGEALLAKTA